MEPLERARRGQHHPHRLPHPGHGVAEGVDAALRLVRVSRERREHDAGRPEHDRHRPGRVDPEPERRCGLVAGAGGDGNPLRHGLTRSRRPSLVGRLEDGREPVAGKLQRVEHVVAPAASRDVEEQRPGRVGGVDRPLAGEPEPHVVLRQHDPGDPPVRVRLVAPEPEELGRREARERPVPCQLDEPLPADPLLDLGAFGGRPLVVPEDRRADHAAVAVEDDEAVHLAREADARNRAPGGDLREGGERGLPPVVRVLLGPAGLRGRERVAARRSGKHGAVGRHRDRLDAGRPDVEADESRLSGHGRAGGAARALALDGLPPRVAPGGGLGRLCRPPRSRPDRPAAPERRRGRRARPRCGEAGFRARDGLLAHAERGPRRAPPRRPGARAVGRKGGGSPPRADDRGIPARAIRFRAAFTRSRPPGAPRSSTGCPAIAPSSRATSCSAIPRGACASVRAAGSRRGRRSTRCGARCAPCSTCRSPACSSRTVTPCCATAAPRSSAPSPRRPGASVTRRRARRRRARRRGRRPCGTAPRAGRRRRSGRRRPR